MAGLGQPGLAQPIPSLPSPHALPTGACNHRDVAGTCGCRQFWDKCSAEVHQHSKERKSSSERSTYCVCGHHACFHEYTNAQAQVQIQPQVRLPARCDGRCRVQGGGCDYHRSPKSRRDQRYPTETQSPLRFKTSNSNGEQRLIFNGASHANGSGVDERVRDGSSMSSTTGLPRIPSMCLLSNDRYPAANVVTRNEADQSRGTIAGLGLSLVNVDQTQNMNDGQNSVVSTVPDEVDLQEIRLQGAHGELDVTSQRARLVPDGQPTLTGLVPGALQAFLDNNASLPLDVEGDTIPNTYIPDEYIQSATEVATPSITHTPDLAMVDKAIDQGKKFVEGLKQVASDMDQRDNSDEQPTTPSSGSASRRPTAHASQEQLQKILKSAPPQAVHELLSYLTPLHNLLRSIPNVARTMTEHDDRISMLEQNHSFNVVHPEDLHLQLDAYEGRLLHLENRVDDHDAFHMPSDADQNNDARRRVAAVNESFGSNHSIQSSTSSALILAAMDRKDVTAEIDGIKERLEVLEAAALPTSLNPWEVEVVLLPWGRDLRGIWFSPDEPMHDHSKSTTQESEEWTQARSSTLGRRRTSMVPFRDTDSSPHPSANRSSHSSHLFSDTESGWSSQEISEWVSGSTNELLSPKACGSNNLVYKRLKSRGLVVNVKFTSANANEIQKTISHAFKDLLERFKYNDEDENPMISSYPGLKASFIPLKKAIGDSRLRFLTPAEMASAALWSAQFLASGVLMRVSGGKKRLYVTQREAYTQPMDQMGDLWTWHEMRLLPRWQPDTDSQIEGNDEHCQPQVPEADAREPCWAFFEPYDAPPASANSSFASVHSIQLSMRPAERDWRRSITPSSILKNRLPPQPISPLSEFHPRPIRHRTVSASIAEPAASSTKRRLNGSPTKQTSAPQSQVRAPSETMSRLKRRRLTSSSSPRPQIVTREAQPTIWANTPRRSREPPSPFYSSEPQIRLPRTSSDLSRPSQRSAALAGKSTPFAYATPHSGPFIGAAGFGGGGDTEADDDIYQDDDDDDDGEQSWRGLTTGEDDSDDDAEAGATDVKLLNFSDGDDDSADEARGKLFSFESHRSKEAGGGVDGDDDEDEEEEDEDDDEDVYDTLLGVLRS